MTASKKHKDSGQEESGKPVSDEAILKVAKEIVVKFIEIILRMRNYAKTLSSRIIFGSERAKELTFMIRLLKVFA